jgi:flagellar biosynthetic protein FliR
LELTDIFDLVYYNFVGFLLVLARVSGVFTFNPIFGRTNIPNTVKAMASIAFAVVMTAGMGNTVGYIPGSVPEFVFVIIKEALLGFVFGIMVNLILSAIIMAGEMMDNQTAFGMANAMDPATGVSMPVFANLYYYLFILYFFITGAHLSYIKLFWLSYETLPIGFSLTVNTATLGYNLVLYLQTAMTLALKLALPVIAAEFILEFSIGILMKAVPSIQVFVLNIQLKILLGLFVMMAIAAPISDFLEELMNILFENLYGSLELIT